MSRAVSVMPDYGVTQPAAAVAHPHAYGIHTSHFMTGLTDASRPKIGLVTVTVSAHR